MQESLCFPIVQEKTLPYLERMFMSQGKPIFFKKNDVIFDYWDEIKSIYYLSKGCCLYLANTVKGNERALSVILPGSSFGEFASVMCEPVNARVEAIENSEVIALPAQLVRERLRCGSENWTDFFKFVYRRQNNFCMVMSYCSEVNVPQRFALFLQSYAKRKSSSPEGGWHICDISITMDRLGEIISANRVTTSAMLNFLGKEDMVRKLKNGGLQFRDILIQNDFIKNELVNSKWCSLKTKKRQPLQTTAKENQIYY